MFNKHKVEVYVPIEKHTLLGKKTELKKQTIELNDRDYRKYKKEQEKQEDDLLMLYETFFDDKD